MRNKRILTLTFVVVAIALLFSGCCPEVCPTIPDCVCPDCPDCVCPTCPDCVCPDCPDCVCPGDELPVISLFETDPDTIYKGETSHLNWLVIGADVVLIDQNIGYVGVVGIQEINADDMPLGVTTYTLTATNSVGSNTATTTITVVGELTVLPYSGQNAINKSNGWPYIEWEINGQCIDFTFVNPTLVNPDPEVGTTYAFNYRIDGEEGTPNDWSDATIGGTGECHGQLFGLNYNIVNVSAESSETVHVCAEEEVWVGLRLGPENDYYLDWIIFEVQ